MLHFLLEAYNLLLKNCTPYFFPVLAAIFEKNSLEWGLFNNWVSSVKETKRATKAA